MTELFIGFAIVGGLVLALGLLSRPLERLPLTGPLVALLLGVALGAQGLDLLHPEQWGDLETILHEAARLSIAIGLMAIALRLPPGYLSRQGRSLAVLLLLAMPLMALAAAALTSWVLGLPLLVALLAGAVLCPTDPIVATSIVTGTVAERRLPERLRHLLLGESGANDGLAFPLVWLPVLLLAQGSGEAWGRWVWHTVLWQVGVAILLGALIGYAAGWLLMRAEKHNAMEVASYFAYTIALTLFSLGVAELLDTDGILAVFVSGVVFGRAVGQRERSQEERVQEAINGFFTLPIFVLLGLTIPWQAWAQLGWRGPALAALILLLRRLPAVLVLRHLAPDVRSMPDALFAGWFGPIGVAALFYAMLAVKHTGEPLLWPLASLMICASVLAHGLTGAPLTLLYARRAENGSLLRQRRHRRGGRRTVR